MSHPKKLIEVSIPLKEINEACAREKSIRHGHPSTLHLWWARRPLAAARAVLFCQLVDDPSGYADELVKDKARAKITEQELLMEPEGEKDLSPRLRERLVEKERERLHDMVRKLVIWENTTNESLFKQARQEILKSWQRHLKREGKPLDTPMPPVLDPFAGGGAIPLEAQRLGMEAHASDLNPVAVLINKAMIEIPPKFAGLPPVNPEWQGKAKEEKAANTWKGAQGLAADVRFYGNWMRDEAKERIGHLYPPYTLTQELIDGRPDLKKAGYTAGDELTVIAWLWARTVPSPNPALQGKPVPLVSSFWLSKKKGKEAYVEPVVENGDYHFEIRVGKPKDATAVEAGTKNGRGANFECVISGIPIGDGHVKEAGRSGNMGAKLMAVVCEGSRGRVYLKADQTQNQAAEDAKPTWRPTEEQPKNPRWFSPPDYGMPTYGDLFTPPPTRRLDDLFGSRGRSEVARSRRHPSRWSPPRRRRNSRTIRHRRPSLRRCRCGLFGICDFSCSRSWFINLHLGFESQDGSASQYLWSTSSPDDLGFRRRKSFLIIKRKHNQSPRMGVQVSRNHCFSTDRRLCLAAKLIHSPNYFWYNHLLRPTLLRQHRLRRSI
jgi:putative DNA methylase